MPRRTKSKKERSIIKHTKDVMQGNNPDKTADYFDGDTYIQHNTAIADESTWQNSNGKF